MQVYLPLDFVMTISLGILGLYFYLKENLGQDVPDISTLPLLAVVAFIVMFSLVFGPIPWMMPEKCIVFVQGAPKGVRDAGSKRSLSKIFWLKLTTEFFSSVIVDWNNKLNQW
uniref:Facilitated trehalose transporter Tret1 n=1 Tax=Cacopsylla melanoneura TaxID=428564 RepID=A0A8D9A6G0_9HEMI